MQSTGTRRWQNWAHTQSCTPAQIFNPTTLADLVAIVKRARNDGSCARAAGHGHTMRPLSVTPDFFVLIAGLKKIGLIDVVQRLATIECCVTIGQLDEALREVGLAVPTTVVLTCVMYGGVIATGCHGAGYNSQTISDLVEAITIVTYTGEVI